MLTQLVVFALTAVRRLLTTCGPRGMAAAGPAAASVATEPAAPARATAATMRLIVLIISDLLCQDLERWGIPLSIGQTLGALSALPVHDTVQNGHIWTKVSCASAERTVVAPSRHPRFPYDP